MNLIPLPYRILIIVAIIAAVLGSFFAWGHRWSSNEWSVRYTERENELLRDVAEAHARALTLEREAATRAADIDAAYQRGRDDVQNRTERTIADLRAGNLRLRHELAAAACELSGPAAATGGDHAGAAAQLWREAAGDLVRLADECDAVVIQLSACQGLLRDYQSAWSPADGR